MKTIHANLPVSLNFGMDFIGIILIVAGVVYWKELGVTFIILGIALIFIFFLLVLYHISLSGLK